MESCCTNSFMYDQVDEEELFLDNVINVGHGKRYSNQLPKFGDKFILANVSPKILYRCL